MQKCCAQYLADELNDELNHTSLSNTAEWNLRNDAKSDVPWKASDNGSCTGHLRWGRSIRDHVAEHPQNIVSMPLPIERIL